jgi:hypothetical protein
MLTDIQQSAQTSIGAAVMKTAPCKDESIVTPVGCML